MMSTVRRYLEPLSFRDLKPALAGRNFDSEELPAGIPLEPLRGEITAAMADLRGTDLDSALIEPLHHSLSDLTRREAADMRVWHWLCVDQFPEVVRRRWNMVDHSNPLSELTRADANRFLGNSTIAGVGRNTFARLWWTAEALGDYDEARLAMMN